MHYLLSLLLLLCSSSSEAGGDRYGCNNSIAPGAMATSRGASCMPTGRQADPFVFCTEGMPMHGWIAVAPLEGQWEPIDEYWDNTWTATFETICPRAMRLGPWQGASPASMTPTPH